MVRLQTLDLRIGVRVPASQPNISRHLHEILTGALRSKRRSGELS